MAHQLAYALAYRDGAGAALAASGHGYLGEAPALVALALALGTVALLAEGVASRGRPGAAAACWPFALAAPLAFVLQEHIERLVESGGFPWHAVGEPSFLLGLALQIPFALAAWLLARTVLRLGGALGARLAAPRPRVTRPIPAASRRPTRRDLAGSSPLASRAAGRAPPR